MAGLTLAASTLLSAQLPVRTTEGVATVVVVAGVAGVLVLFVAWFLMSSLFYFMTKPVANGGRFGRTMRLVGWSFLPLPLSGVLSVAVVFVVVSSLPTPETTRQLSRVQSQLTSDPLVRMNLLVSTAFYIWQGVLLAFAVKHGREVSLRTAVAVVALPVLGTVGWSLSSAL